MKSLVFIFSFLCHFYAVQAQEKGTPIRTQELPAIRYDKNFELHYYQELNKIKRTYPLALRAKEVLDSLDIELASENKKRKQQKITKAKKKELEEELEFLVKDLYMGEGKMLFKLIHRETGLTVTEILAKYRGNLYAKSVQATFSLYGHQTNSTFDAQGEDWIVELVLQDIESGRRSIDMNVHGISKAEYRQNLKDYRDYRKDLRKKKRSRRKNKRKNDKKRD